MQRAHEKAGFTNLGVLHYRRIGWITLLNKFKAR